MLARSCLASTPAAASTIPTATRSRKGDLDVKSGIAVSIQVYSLPELDIPVLDSDSGLSATEGEVNAFEDGTTQHRQVQLWPRGGTGADTGGVRGGNRGRAPRARGDVDARRPGSGPRKRLPGGRGRRCAGRPRRDSRAACPRGGYDARAFRDNPDGARARSRATRGAQPRFVRADDRRRDRLAPGACW